MKSETDLHSSRDAETEPPGAGLRNTMVFAIQHRVIEVVCPQLPQRRHDQLHALAIIN